MCDDNKEKPYRFPYELLVQIYNQRLQIMWFAIACSLAFLGAFYTAFTDPYDGDLGITPIIIITIGTAVSIALFFFECRNLDILKALEHKMTCYHKRKAKDPSITELIIKNENVPSFSVLINLIFIILYSVEGLAFGTIIKTTYNSPLTKTLLISLIPPLTFFFLLVYSSLCKKTLNCQFHPKNQKSGNRYICNFFYFEDEGCICKNENNEESKPKAPLIKNCFKIFIFFFIPFLSGTLISTTLISINKEKFESPENSSEIRVDLIDFEKK